MDFTRYSLHNSQNSVDKRFFPFAYLPGDDRGRIQLSAVGHSAGGALLGLVGPWCGGGAR